MKYTIKFDLHIDSDEIWEDDEIIEMLEEGLDTCCIDVRDVKILEVND